MNKKKKNRKIKRVLALLGVVVVLASLIVIPTSAWEVTDIPFYNYFDVSKTSGASATWGGKVTSVDPESGTIKMNGTFTRDSQLCMVFYYEEHGRTLREFCPEMVVGETYVLTALSDLKVGNYGSTSSVEAINGIGLADENNQGIVWYSGEALEMTEELLSRRVYFYVGKSIEDEFFEPCSIENTLQVWINKDEAYDFCSHELSREFNEEAYNKGYQDAHVDQLNKSGVFTEKTMISASFSWHSLDNPGYADKHSYYNKNSGILYPFNGYSFNSNAFNSAYYVPPNNYRLDNISVIFDLRESGVEYYFGSLPLVLTVSGCRVQITFATETGGEPRAFVDGTATPKTIDLNSLFASQHYNGEKIEVIALYIYCADDTTENTEYNYAFYANLSTGSVGGLEYEMGYNDGYDRGHQIAQDENYIRGEKDGYKEGKDIGYEMGKDDGYWEGRADEAKQDSFFSMIYSVIDAPVQVLSKTLNFKIMGVDMLGLASSLLTFAILVTVVKYFV